MRVRLWKVRALANPEVGHDYARAKIATMKMLVRADVITWSGVSVWEFDS